MSPGRRAGLLSGVLMLGALSQGAGFLTAPAEAGVENPMALGVDLPGSDIQTISIPNADPAICRQACDAAPSCKAWTFVKPGVQAPQAQCWLKSAVPPAIASRDTISGVRTVAASEGAHPGGVAGAAGQSDRRESDQRPVSTPGVAAAPPDGVELCNVGNGGGTQNAPPNAATPCRLTRPAHVTRIGTYHWNNARGATPGTITLRDARSGARFGPFQAVATSGQGGAPNVNWTVAVDLRLAAGDYEVVDSDVATWSWNQASQGYGFASLRGVYEGPGAGHAVSGSTPAAPVAPAAQAVDATHYKLELPGYWGHLEYTISGAKLDPPTGSDSGNVGGRQYRGRINSSALTVEGWAVSDNDSSGPGSGDYYELVVTVGAGKQTKEGRYTAPRGEKLNKHFLIAVPVDPDATSGRFNISLLEQNANYGPHGWIVSGMLDRVPGPGSPSSNSPQPTAVAAPAVPARPTAGAGHPPTVPTSRARQAAGTKVAEFYRLHPNAPPLTGARRK